MAQNIEIVVVFSELEDANSGLSSKVREAVVREDDLSKQLKKVHETKDTVCTK